MSIKAQTRFWLIALCLLSAACTQPMVQRDASTVSVTPPVPGTEEDRRALAGEWEYEDGAIVTLVLDEQGNGTYPWKEGRFETTTLADHTWHGRWIQNENDREGGFVVEFLPDFSEGEGRWWYSRIGSDRAPTQKGGTFHLSRKSSQIVQSETPSLP